MGRKCIICGKEIEENYNKLQGTVVKVKEGNKNKHVYVCSECQKKEKWIEMAKIKSV